ncbi:3074_t:CDS:2 [Rhizophagus irregularis]|nr:3074_t:CDS:2 [Rhizophagus irregularis]
MDLEKSKTKNHQVTREAEKKFKDSKITRDCSNTEKNSIAFSMTVALNYLDPSKGINMIPSEVIE